MSSSTTESHPPTYSIKQSFPTILKNPLKQLQQKLDDTTIFKDLRNNFMRASLAPATLCSSYLSGWAARRRACRAVFDMLQCLPNERLDKTSEAELQDILESLLYALMTNKTLVGPDFENQRAMLTSAASKFPYREDMLVRTLKQTFQELDFEEILKDHLQGLSKIDDIYSQVSSRVDDAEDNSKCWTIGSRFWLIGDAIQLVEYARSLHHSRINKEPRYKYYPNGTYCPGGPLNILKSYLFFRWQKSAPRVLDDVLFADVSLEDSQNNFSVNIYTNLLKGIPLNGIFGHLERRLLDRAINSVGPAIAKERKELELSGFSSRLKKMVKLLNENCQHTTEGFQRRVHIVQEQFHDQVNDCLCRYRSEHDIFSQESWTLEATKEMLGKIMKMARLNDLPSDEDFCEGSYYILRVVQSCQYWDLANASALLEHALEFEQTIEPSTYEGAVELLTDENRDSLGLLKREWALFEFHTESSELNRASFAPIQEFETFNIDIAALQESCLRYLTILSTAMWRGRSIRDACTMLCMDITRKDMILIRADEGQRAEVERIVNSRSNEARKVFLVLHQLDIDHRFAILSSYRQRQRYFNQDSDQTFVRQPDTDEPYEIKTFGELQTEICSIITESKCWTFLSALRLVGYASLEQAKAEQKHQDSVAGMSGYNE